MRVVNAVLSSLALTIVCVSRSAVSDSLRPHGLWPARLFCLWNSPGENTGASCHFLLQEIFLTQGSHLASPALAGGFFTSCHVSFCTNYGFPGPNGLKNINISSKNCGHHKIWFF